MLEKDFQTRFGKWATARWPLPRSSAFELKVCNGTSLPFDAVKEHQLAALRGVGRRFVYKIPDVGFDQKPFDCFMLDRAPGYVVIGFCEPRKKVRGYAISVHTFESYRDFSSKSSLTEEECRLIAQFEFEC